MSVCVDELICMCLRVSWHFDELLCASMCVRARAFVFDELSQKHNVFKVETIGDAYMAVTNLEENQVPRTMCEDARGCMMVRVHAHVCVCVDAASVSAFEHV
eukprot:2357852-Rhodomonas_salina.1